MRVELPGIRRASEPFEFEFDGRRVAAYPGETVAAALMAAGLLEMRETRFGDRRGVFCGMGVCGECVVLVDGVTRRACQELVTAGSKVSRHPARAPVSEADSLLPAQILTPDVLIVGAGPAGLAAAQAATESGLEVVIVDERKSAGGQYFKQPGSAFAVDAGRLDGQFREGRELAESARTAGAVLIPEATVWGAFAGQDDSEGSRPYRVEVVTPQRRLTIRPRRLVLACGAYERGVPFPGWTLPGVITTGAAQTLLRASQVTPGKRVLIAGNGPLNLQVAGELSAVGVEVVALVEVAPSPRLSAVGALAAMALASPRLVVDGIKHTLALRRHRVPVMYRHALIRVEGAGRAERAVVARIDYDGRPVSGTERGYDVDAVCMGYGFLPQSEFARALGCRHAYDSVRGGLAVERDDDGRTSRRDIFVVGDAGGLGGARIAMSQGTLAGLAVSRDLGCNLDAQALHSEKDARRSLHRHRRFQRALWFLYRGPLLVDQLATADTLVCRCEGVSKGTLIAMAEEAGAAGALKRLSRAGMGRCQGRYCGPVIAGMLRQRAGTSLEETDFFAPRPPFRPVPVGSLAGEWNPKPSVAGT